MFHVSDEINPRWSGERTKWSAERRRRPAFAFPGVSGDSRGVAYVETGKVHSFVPPRLLPWFSWADDVEEEERREEAKREHERRAWEKVERKWRERSS